MKKKKLKKLSKFIVSEIRNGDKISKPIREHIDYCDYDSSVSERLKSLIINLIQYKQNIHINISDSYFNISTNDIKKLKLPATKHTYNDEEYLEISVNLEGFTINKGYNIRSNYKDENIFNELKPIVSERLLEINRENFNEIWESIIKDSGIIRDNNLNQLFDE